MKTVAIVPVKRLSEAKTRLAGILSPEERVQLAHEMLLHVLATVIASGVIDTVAVISPEPVELRLPPGVVPLVQNREGLNSLLEQGREWAGAVGADALLVLFADLPLLAPEDISRIVELGKSAGSVVLAPDRHGSGTNGMLAHPPSLARFAFGPGSFNAHRSQAQQAGVHIEVYRASGTAFDIDTLDDLESLEAHRVATAMQYAFS
ncbi:MAG: 2-phospho-L-lactate guanylyltransferase [Chloroflexota bacterium]